MQTFNNVRKCTSSIPNFYGFKLTQMQHLSSFQFINPNCLIGITQITRINKSIPVVPKAGLPKDGGQQETQSLRDGAVETEPGETAQNKRPAGTFLLLERGEEDSPHNGWWLRIETTTMTMAFVGDDDESPLLMYY